MTEAEKLADLINSLRIQIGDKVASKNILNGGKQEYTDSELEDFLKEGVKDINRGRPKLSYTIYDLPDDDLIVKSAMFIWMFAEGIVQLRNQLDYSDSGFTISMFNKTSGYQSWASLLLQTYMMDKTEFRQSQIINANGNAGFYGISSEFGLMAGGDEY